jgi:hypothetical protein
MVIVQQRNKYFTLLYFTLIDSSIPIVGRAVPVDGRAVSPVEK